MSDDPTGSDPVEPTRPEPIPSERLDPPTAEVTGEPTTEAAPAAAPTAETPTYAPPTAEAPPAYVPPAAGAPTQQVPVATDAPARSRGVMVPWWALGVVAALVVFGGGYLIGHAVGDDHGDGRTSARFAVPGGRNGGNEFPFGGGNGNGNGNPFGGNGNGPNPFGGGNGSNNGNGGNGNGNGGSRPSTQSTAFLGVGVADAANGVRVTTVVAGGPASDAGIAQSAVITAIDGTKVTDVASLRSAVAQHQPGDTVKVTYTSNGATKTATVTLGDRNASS